MTVEFVFEIDQKVVTPLGKPGIVSMCALDDTSNRTYFVKTDAGGDWFQERLLKAAE
jgi:hypothetical protein